jgi:glycosyltransferase involved in cell wall biosynthesis
MFRMQAKARLNIALLSQGKLPVDARKMEIPLKPNGKKIRDIFGRESKMRCEKKCQLKAIPGKAVGSMENIVHLTTVHPRNDVRIFIKQARTLATEMPHKVWLVVSDGKADDNKNQGRVSVHDLGNLGSGRLIRMLRGPWCAFCAIGKIRPTIVHFHDPELIPLGLILKIVGYKVIYDVHEDVPRQILFKHYLPFFTLKPLALAIHGLEMLGAKVFDAIVPATPQIAKRFPSHKTIVIQNFPIITELVNHSAKSYIERPKIFVYAGGLSIVRGVREMVEAINMFEAGSKVRLDLAGSFSPKNTVEKLQTMQDWSFINYHGQLTRAELVNILNNAIAGLVLFHPIPNHLNAQPNKMFEYMAVGLPVIASDFPLWRRIIDEAGCGLLVDPLDPRAIARAMQWILDNPEEAEAMGCRGKAAVADRYNWDSQAVKLVGLYERLLGDKRV